MNASASNYRETADCAAQTPWNSQMNAVAFQDSPLTVRLSNLTAEQLRACAMAADIRLRLFGPQPTEATSNGSQKLSENVLTLTEQSERANRELISTLETILRSL